MEKRLLAIQGWILEDYSQNIIIQQIIQKQWCSSRRHAERLIAKALDEWKEVEADNISDKRKRKVLQLQQTKRSLKAEYRGTPEGIRALAAIDKLIIIIDGLAAVKPSADGPIIINNNNSVQTHTVPAITIINPHFDGSERSTNEAAV